MPTWTTPPPSLARRDRQPPQSKPPTHDVAPSPASPNEAPPAPSWLLRAWHSRTPAVARSSPPAPRACPRDTFREDLQQGHPPLQPLATPCLHRSNAAGYRPAFLVPQSPSNTRVSSTADQRIHGRQTLTFFCSASAFCRRMRRSFSAANCALRRLRSSFIILTLLDGRKSRSCTRLSRLRR
jgi:hypothetical protein